jgi:hypothetical protein
MKTKIYKCLVVLFALFSVGIGRAQINIANTSPVVENFNSMSTGTNTPANWRIQQNASPSWASAVGTGLTAANSGSPATGDHYNWGNSGGTDRALGAMTSGSFASPNSVLAQYRNTNAANITQLTVSYNLEKYRTNSAAASVQFFYSIDGTSWTAFTAGDIAAATIGTGSNTYNFAAPVTYSVSAFNITGLNIANGANIYLRWNLNTTGSNSQGIGIDDVSVTGTFAAATPTKLVISSISPTSPTAGSGFNVTIQAQDAGNTPRNVVANTVFTLSNTNGGTIGGVTTGTLTAGTNSVVVSGVTLSAAATNVTLTATRNSGDVLTAGTSATFTVVSAGGTPTKFVITSISPTSPVAGSGFNVVVQSQDAGNILQNVSANTDFSLTTNGNAGTIGGTTTGTIPMGASSFTVTGVTLSTAGTGATLTATRTSGDNLTAGTSSSFTVLGVADHLTFVGVPSSGTAGGVLTAFTVEARRADNSVDVNYTGNVTVSKASGPGTLSGTTTVAAVAGVATFSTLSLDQGGSYTLQASSGSLSNATSGSITITVSPVTWNFTTAAPSSGTPVANLTVSNMTVVNSNGSPAMISATSPSSGYTGASGANNAGASTVNGASLSVSGSSYFQFTLTPAAGYYVALDELSFGTRSTGTGPTTYALRSSKDNYASNIATGSIATNSTWSLKTNSFSAVYSATGTAITYRLYGYGGSGAQSGTVVWRIDDVILSLDVQQCVTPVTSILAQTNVSCFGGTNGAATVSATGGPGYTYSWAPSGGTAATASSLATGTYTCTVVNIAGGCSVTQTVTITQPVMALGTSVSSQTAVSCNGGNNGAATILATGGTPIYTYSWAPSGGTAATASSLTAGTYTCTVTDANGCVTTQTVTIAQPAMALGTSVSSQTDVSCNGLSDGSATVSVTGGTPTYMYAWMPSGGSTATASGLVAGAYTCTITDANGCTTMQSVNIAQPLVLAASVSSQTNVSCNGLSDGFATISPTGGTPTYMYSWAPSGGTTATASGLAVGDYTCTITDANGCTTMQAVSITQPSVLTASVSSQTNVNCNGANDGAATVDLTGGTPTYIYAWAPSGGSAATGASLTAGTYTCTITDANGCITTQSVTITEPASALMASLASSTDVSCNGGSDGAAGISVSGGTAGYLFSWAPSGGSTGTATNLSAGVYTCTVTDANGCIAIHSVTISQPGTLTVNSNMTQSGCSNNNGAISLSVSGGTPTYLYSWSNGATTQNISGLSIGSYTATVTDSKGCTTQKVTAVTTSCSIPPTQLWASQCGQTLPDLSGSFYCNAVANAVDYEWEITNSTLGYSVTVQRGNSSHAINKTSFPGMQFGQTYDIRVRAKIGSTWGVFSTSCSVMIATPVPQLSAAQCGQTVPDLSGWFYSSVIDGAQDYEWEFTNSGLGYSFTTTRNQAVTSIPRTNITGLQFGQTYNVRIRAKVGGIWGNFGNTCAISIGTPTPQLTAAYCGQTIADFSGYFYTTVIDGAQDYEWEFTNSGLGYSFTKQRGSGNTSMLRADITGLQYAQTYNVRIRAKVAGVWGSFGNTCTVTTGAFPTTKLRNDLCGATFNLSGFFYCDALNGAQDYEWEFTGTSYNFTLQRGSGISSLPRPSVTGLQNGQTYTVRVRAKVGGNWGTFGTSCSFTINTSATARLIATEAEPTIENEMDLVAYPNPFNTNLSIAVTGVENGAALLEIYNALGEKVYSSTPQSSTMELDLKEWSNGIYYVMLTNGKARVSKKILKQE